jgi:PAS domain S-box-containing protein
MRLQPLPRLHSGVPAIGQPGGASEPGSASARVLGIAMRIGRLSAWTLDVAGMVLHWSSEALAIHGFDTQPSGAGTLPQLLGAIDLRYRAHVEQAIEGCIVAGTAFDLEALVHTQRQQPIWIRLIGEAERGAGGQVVRVRGAVQDVTEPKEVTARARETSERLIATLESISDAFFTVDREWRFSYVNREAERLLRRPRDQLLGRVLWEEFPQAVESAFHREYERALATFQAVEFEAPYEPLHIWAQVKAFPSPHGLAVYFRDVTEERRVRRALTDSEERHRMLFEASIDAILRGRPDGTIDDANPAACALFGLPEDELRRRGRDGLVDPNDARLSLLSQRRTQSGAGTGELTLLRGDGSRFEAEVSTFDYHSGQGEAHTYVIVRDVTERLRSRQQVEALNAELAERVRVRTAQLESANAELKTFAHSLAHDLRSMIATVDRFAEVLERSLAQGGSERDAHYLSRIRAAAGRMDDFTQALLSLAQVSQTPLIRQRIDLGAIATQVLAELQERDRGRAVSLSVQQGLVVEGDPRLLRIALENLLGNAWKFTSRRAVAEIVFGAHGGDGGERVYFVRDNGVGFDAAYAHRLFGTFQRLHSVSEFPGTGVGLASVQRIVGRHGGRVWAESVEGEGATLSFTLGETTPAG